MDKVTFRILLVLLGIFEIVLLAGAFVLQLQDKQIPDFVVAAIPSVLSGMLGLAVHTTPAEPVQVVNAPGDAIDVDGGDHRV